jgi:glutamate racemase
MNERRPIGIFDSGYGGLTVFRAIRNLLPQYDFMYLGDTARAPYGNRSFDTVHEYTRQCVEWFFRAECPLVILACNTASAKALRTIQQQDLSLMAPQNRVLGVIRPTAEVIGNYTRTGHIGILGTRGTVNSGSYEIEIKKFFPGAQISQLACPMWVPLIENGSYEDEGTDFYVQKYLDELLRMDNRIDTILLACTHYPILINKIKKHLPAGIEVVSQGSIVAHSLYDYLQRHAEIDHRLTKNGHIELFTTDDTADFDAHATLFFEQQVKSAQAHL